jgi:broad specificity phosphatase PhoE
MPHEIPTINPEKQFEVEPELRFIKVYRVRHGKSVYHEHTEGKNNIPEDELDLTSEGVRDIEKAAEIIKEHIDPKRDTVVLISSPRRRAKSAIKIIGDRLGEAFKDQNIIQTLADNPKYEKRLESFASANLVDENGKPIKTDDSRYPKLFAEQVPRLKDMAKEAGLPTSGFLASHPDEQFGQFERTIDLNKRIRRHLTLLVLAARIKQPQLAKLGKRLVIIEVEHNETLDEMYEKASKGKYTFKTKTPDEKGTGAVEGEVLEMLIPSDKNSNEIRVNFLGEGREKDEKIIAFDSRKREFAN